MAQLHHPLRAGQITQRVAALGVTITDAAVDEKVTTIFCAPVARDPRCPDCGREGTLPRHHHPPVDRSAGRRLPAGVCGSLCPATAVSLWTVGGWCSTRIWASWRRRDQSTTRRCARYVLRRLMIDRTTVSAIAAELGVSWHTVNSIAMRATAELVAAAGPDRLAGVTSDRHR